MVRTLPPREAANSLLEGQVGLVPTETVVGLVAAEAGLRRLYEIKHRGEDKPIALLCRTPEEAFERALEVPALARELAEEFWPGPLTLVLAARSGGTVGLRIPAGAAVREVLEGFGGPLYATSANITGQPAPASPEEVDPRVVSAVDFVVEGEAGSGEASAVVDLSGPGVRVLRPAGRLTEENLLRRGDRKR
jgi:L-threonylcarbamoyladenylate synthase